MTLVWKILRARRERRVMRTVSERLRPLLRGLRYLVANPASGRVSLHCPEYVTPSREAAEVELVRRIFRSFKEMKRDQRSASELYLPSSQWQAQLDEAYAPLAEALRDDDVGPFHLFLANFGTWKTYHGVESTTLIREGTRSLLKRRYLENDVFLGQLRTWKWFYDARKQLERLTYPMHGNQAGAYIDGVFVGPGSFFNEIYGSLLATLIEGIDRPVVADLGAGYGKLAYFTLRDRDAFTFVDFDLPETLCLAAYYLMKVWPQKRVLLYGEGDIGREGVEGCDLVFMPSYEIEKLRPSSVDLFVNKNSLGEMTRDAVRNYVHHIARSTRSFFFHMNHEIHRNVYADGTWGLLGYEYPVPEREFRLLMRYPDLGHLLYQGYLDLGMDIFFYLYERRRQS